MDLKRINANTEFIAGFIKLNGMIMGIIMPITTCLGTPIKIGVNIILNKTMAAQLVSIPATIATMEVLSVLFLWYISPATNT